MNETVLVVEDSKTYSKVLARSIQHSLGPIAVVAHSLKQAKEILESEKHRFFAAIIDLHLPDSSEGEMVEEVLSRNIPTIVLTGNYNKAVRDKILKTDILDYMVKGGHVLQHIISLLRRLRTNCDIKVLVVDDSFTARNLVKRLLKKSHYQVLEATDGSEALDLLKENPEIKLVITDYNMPGMDGFDLITHIRKGFTMDELGIIGLSSSSELSAQFLKIGANDFLDKDFSVEEFNCRVRLNLDMVDRFEEIRKASTTDHLTQLCNRRYFFKTANSLYSVCKRGKSPIALAMLDLDFFKKINDTYGHQAGDAVLRKVGNFLKTHTRQSDIVARYGGEEFCLLATNISKSAATYYFEKLRKGVENLDIICGSDRVKLSVSVGVETAPGKDLEEMLKKADRFLYQAKEDGRNRVILNGAAIAI